MKISKYKSVGKTPYEAFCGIWDVMRDREDCILRQVGDEWVIELRVAVPDQEEL